MNDSSNQDSLRRITLVSAAILALPPLLALLAAAFPGLIPIPFVDVRDPAAARPYLIATGIGLLVVNAIFLVGLRKFFANRSS